jgi:phage minor structural protein
MIQVYEASNTDFNSNGDMTLTPSKAEIHAILNGAWTASLSHPIDKDGRWKFIEENAVVKMPSFLEDDQLFRIKKRTVSDSGVEAELEPIFYDSIGDCFLVDVRPTNDNGQQALDMMTAVNSKYSGSSNITKTSTAYYQFKNLMEAINGEDDNAFVKRWGGEILFDNFEVIIDEQVGSDHGVELRYGKNLPVDGLTEDVDMTEVVTRIYPKAYNGYVMTNNGYVDSDLLDNYPTVLAKTITFDDVKMAEDAQEDDEENGVIVCETQTELDAALTQRCNEQYAAGLDKPKVTLTADMVLLQNAEQYKDFQVLERVSLGDTIHCYHKKLGITTEARAIELTYDAILKKTSDVVLGDFEYNYFNNVSSSINRIDGAIRPNGSVVAEKVQGFIDGAFAQLRLQNTIAKKQNVRAILFEDLDETSPTFGAMALGTQGLQISRERTADGSDWEWTTALTSDGLIANIVVAGILSDKLGENSWNLDTGDFTIKKGSINITVDNDFSIIQLTGKSVKNEDIKCTISPGQCTIENITQETSAIMQSHMMAFQKNGQNVVYADKNGLYVNSVNNVAIMGTWSGTFPIPGYDVEVVSGIIKDITPA